MNKKLMLGLAIIFIIALGAVSFFYREPTPFLTVEEMKDMLNKQPDIASSIKILDVFETEESFRLVPFTTEDGRSGMSYWALELFQWKLVGYEWNQHLKIWKLNPNNPKSYYFVWHFAPQEEATQMNIYFLQDRSFRITGGTQFYTPRIQLHMNIDLTKNSYGMMPIPENWLRVITGMASMKDEDLFTSMLGTSSSYYFGWQTLDGQNQEAPLTLNQNSQSHWLEDTDFYIGNVMNIYEEQLEKP